MNHGVFWTLSCVLVLLCSACGDDDQGTADPAATRDERDSGGSGDEGEDEGDDEAGDEDESGGAGSSGAGRGGDMPSDGGEGSDPDPDPTTMDASTPPSETGDGGGGEDPGDAAPGQDAGDPVTDCESLAACCEQLREQPRGMCERAVEAGDDMTCAAFARRACLGAGDGGMPAPAPCEGVLECCAALEGREQVACEAAAAAPEGRACERAIEMYCR